MNANEFIDIANRFSDSSKLRAGCKDLGGRFEPRPTKSINCHCYRFFIRGDAFHAPGQAINLSFPAVQRRAK